MLGRAEFYSQRGFNVVLVDLRAHGESEADYLTAGMLEQHDVAATIDFSRNLFPGQRIVIDAWSLGGAASVLATPDVDAMILESVFPDIDSAVQNRIAMRLGRWAATCLKPLLVAQMPLRIGVWPSQLRPVDSISHLQCPIMILTGSEDQRTTMEESKSLLDAITSPKELVVFEGIGHEDLFAKDPDRFKKSVIQFLNQHVLDQPANKEVPTKNASSPSG